MDHSTALQIPLLRIVLRQRYACDGFPGLCLWGANSVPEHGCLAPPSASRCFAWSGVLYTRLSTAPERRLQPARLVVLSPDHCRPSSQSERTLLTLRCRADSSLLCPRRLRPEYCACIGIEVAVFLVHYWHCGLAQEERKDVPGKPTERRSKLSQRRLSAAAVACSILSVCTRLSSVPARPRPALAIVHPL